MIGTKEQAEVYLAQGSLCRAAAVMQQIVAVEPTTANRELLAEIYMQQGLHEDAMLVLAATITSNVVAGSSYVN